MYTENYRILIIDDLGSLHEDFNDILIPKRNSSAVELQKLSPLLFDDPKESEVELPPFKLSSAFQGAEGLELVRASLLNRQPYALAFVDIVMPPGLDGVETIIKLWEIDPDVQVVICTAYAKYSWEDLRKKLGNKENLFILKKPFDRIEVLQLACALTKKWSTLQLLKRPIKNQKMDSRDFDIDKTIAFAKSSMNELEKILKKF